MNADRFAELGAPPPLREALAARGYAEPTTVQAAVLDPALAGRDLLVSSRTGSGKTVAFGLAFAPQVLQERGTALVIAPTRELALQVQTELQWLYAKTGLRTAALVGGREMRQDLRQLATRPQLIVGTPGRLVDHLERKSLNLEGLRALVLDEADEMLDMGFREELETILGAAPPERRTLLFSATLPEGILHIAAKYQHDAARVAATPSQQAHQDIETRVHLIAPREREHAVVNTLRASDAESAIVFCATRDAVAHLHASLSERGFPAVALSGELTQPERARALQALRDGRARVLVATDVAARGLDLPDVGLVVQADLPHDAQVLQHRSGRTGRAGRKGVSVLLVPGHMRMGAERLLRNARLKVAFTPPPSAESIHALDRTRLRKGIDALLAEPVDDEDAAVAAELLQTQSPQTLAALLVRLRRETLPAPEELPLTAALGRATSARKEPRTERTERTDRTERSGPAIQRANEAARSHPRAFLESVWFRVNVGRTRNADTKWLVPMLYRRGAASKGEIGRIQIMENETRFEVTAPAASRFEAKAALPDEKDPNIRIVREKAHAPRRK